MKLISSLFAATVLALGISAFAQAPEEQASVSVEATSESTPVPGSAEKPDQNPTNPNKQAESTSSIWDETPAPSATPSKKPAALTKTAVPVKTAAPAKAATAAKAPTPAPTAAPAAAKPGKKMNVEGSLKEMENKWEASIPKHDAAAVEQFIATDYAGVSSKGKFTDKTSMLSEIKADDDTYKSAKNEKLSVHLYGPSVAVVTGTAREKGTGKAGTAFDRTYRFTDTWVERNGQWQCVASHSALVPGK